ncbi:MAG: prephenate dehydratase [Candidatus Limnocylindrales bacterium]
MAGASGPTRIAYPGEPGSFAEEAALATIPGAVALALPGFADVCAAVNDGRLPGDRAEEPPLAAGVLPIENVLGGTVRETYDLLLAHDLIVVDEVVVPVSLCLAALPGERLEGIARVYSHVQALAQAGRFLGARPWTLLTTYNTAAAGRLLVEGQERSAGAVLSPRAAAHLGLDVLAREIEDEPDDRTRFLVLARPAASWTPRGPARPCRTTIVFGLRNEPGALAAVLGGLAGAGLNLSKLESRPLRGRAWEYVFWADLDADAREAPVADALDELRARVSFLRVLGSYPRASEPGR